MLVLFIFIFQLYFTGFVHILSKLKTTIFQGVTEFALGCFQITFHITASLLISIKNWSFNYFVYLLISPSGKVTEALLWFIWVLLLFNRHTVWHTDPIARPAAPGHMPVLKVKCSSWSQNT